MLRRARLRTVPGDTPNSAAVAANAAADISPCPLRQTVRTPTAPSAPPEKQSRRRSPDRSTRPARPRTARRTVPRLGETCSCSALRQPVGRHGPPLEPTMVASALPPERERDRMFARTLPATFRCRHQGNSRISSHSWVATSASVSGLSDARRATAIAPGSNARATTHTAGRQSPPEGEPIWTNACSTSSAASMPTSIDQSGSPSTAGADASRRVLLNPVWPQLPGLCQSLRQVRHPELFDHAHRSCSFRALRRRSQGYVTRIVPPRSICGGYVWGCNDIAPQKPRTPESRGRRDRPRSSPCLSGV